MILHKDMKYLLRNLDLIMNKDVRDTFRKRSAILKELRAFLDSQGYIEVDTPTLLPIEIGADARPFKTHHNALNIDMYMRIATELPLKRLIVGGMNRVYEIGRIFRNEGMDLTHNPEFTTIELYEAYGDLSSMMRITEGMIRHAASKVTGKININADAVTIKVLTTYIAILLSLLNFKLILGHK